MRILLVEDDDLLGDGLINGLEQEQYYVEWVQDGMAADNVLKESQFDVVILDLGLPRMSGLDVLKKMRKRGNYTPVLILTAQGETEDKVKGLDAGADDYLGKPFDLDELFARVRALQRRKQGFATDIIQHRDIELEPKSYRVTKKGVDIELSKREFDVLKYLLENRGRVVQRFQLEEKIYGWEKDIASNSVEVFVHHIRKKLGEDLIRTIRGVGYTIEKI